MPGIVEHNVESSKDLLSPGKSGSDVRRTGNVESENQKLRGRVLFGERRKTRGFAKCCNDDVALAEGDFRDGFSQPGGRSGDYRIRGRCVSVSLFRCVGHALNQTLGWYMRRGWGDKEECQVNTTR